MSASNNSIAIRWAPNCCTGSGSGIGSPLSLSLSFSRRCSTRYIHHTLLIRATTHLVRISSPDYLFTPDPPASNERLFRFTAALSRMDVPALVGHFTLPRYPSCRPPSTNKINLLGAGRFAPHAAPSRSVPSRLDTTVTEQWWPGSGCRSERIDF